MKIVTKQLSKNHNVSSESDSSLFIRYVGFFLFLIFIVYVFFFSLSLVLVRFISVEDEMRLFGASLDGISADMIRELPEAMAERYADIPYSIKLIDMDDIENAFASLGGNIYITEAFLDQVEYWEELDFIIGHELGHVEHRDVFKGLIAEIPVTIILGLFGGDYGGVLFQGVISNNHSKMQETKADSFGLDYAYQKNGHVGCAMNFFEKTNSLEDNVIELFSTHPITSLRIERAYEYAKKMGYKEGECNTFDISLN